MENSAEKSFLTKKTSSESESDFLNKLYTALEASQKKAAEVLNEKHKAVLSWAASVGIPVDNLLPKLVNFVTVPVLSAAMLTSSMLPAFPAAAGTIQNYPSSQQVQAAQEQQVVAVNKAEILASIQQSLQSGSALSDQQARDLSTLVSQITDIKATPELEGFRLNKSFGKIGGEQHMPRYPGDTISEQLPNPEDYAKYAKSGMTPGRSAWGYFAPSKQALTPDLIEKEKYYFAVQTFLSPNWKGNVKEAYKWFKHRKVVALNPVNGKAVVGVIGDAGPAEWVGKAYGGSPEIMQYIRAWDKPAKGEILLFFVDDPENKIPLGPVNISY